MNVWATMRQLLSPHNPLAEWEAERARRRELDAQRAAEWDRRIAEQQQQLAALSEGANLDHLRAAARLRTLGHDS